MNLFEFRSRSSTRGYFLRVEREGLDGVENREGAKYKAREFCSLMGDFEAVCVEAELNIESDTKFLSVVLI